jgi:DUF438 domain-containing protein
MYSETYTTIFKEEYFLILVWDESTSRDDWYQNEDIGSS